MPGVNTDICLMKTVGKLLLWIQDSLTLFSDLTAFFLDTFILVSVCSQADERMVSITQKSRDCVSRLLLSSRSIIPSLSLCFFTVILLSVCPPCAVADVQTPNAAPAPGIDTNKSIFTPLSNLTYSNIRNFVLPSNKDTLTDTHPTSLSKNIFRTLLNVTKFTLSSTSAFPEHSFSNSSTKKLSYASTSHPVNKVFSFISETSPSSTPPLKTSSTTKKNRSRQVRPSQPLPQTTPPLFDHQPFIVSWNIPDLVCKKYNVSLDTSPFKGVATPAKVGGPMFCKR